MTKKCVILFVFFLFTSIQAVQAADIQKVEDSYFTTEDIISDLIFPIVDKRVIKEYDGDALFSWNWQRIVGIQYNNDHSYDISVRIQIPSQQLDNDQQDIVKVRISPSCDSGKLNKRICNHDFKIEVVDYQHVSE